MKFMKTSKGKERKPGRNKFAVAKYGQSVENVCVAGTAECAGRQVVA